MGFKLLDINKFIKEKEAKQVTSSNILIKKNNGWILDNEGLYSEDIFGYTINDQSNKIGYIDLKTVILHPLINKNLKKISSLFAGVANRTKKVTIENGMLVESSDSDSGKTGLQFLIDNWDKIDLEKYKKETNLYFIEFLQKVKKDLIFINKIPVIQIIYRPHRVKNDRVEIDEVTEFYQKILLNLYNNQLQSQNMAKFQNNNIDSKDKDNVKDNVKDEDLFGMLFNNENKSEKLQKIVQALYDYFISKLEKKEGFFTSKLMGKRLDNVTRLVANARPDVPIDCVVMPWHSLLNIFDALVIGYLEAHIDIKEKLGLKDLTTVDIGKHLYYIYKNCDIYCKSNKDKIDIWYKILEDVFNENPHVRVLMKRDPGWSAQSFWVLKPLINRGCQYVAIVPSFYYVPLGGDSFNCNIFIYKTNQNKILEKNENKEYIYNNIYSLKTLTNFFNKKK